MANSDEGPGWDKKAINRIAKDEYGDLNNMFEAHGWDLGERSVSQIAPTRVVETYGSVKAFAKAHEGGRDLNPTLDVAAAFRSDPPQVFLKSFHGFTPESWGFLGFSETFQRDRFLRLSKPGALLVVAGTRKAPDPNEQLRVLGMQQQSHIEGSKWQFLAPERHEEEKADPDRVNGWIYGLKALRAWKIPKESRPFVRDIFPDTHAGGRNGTAIGSYGMQLTFEEAQRVLDLPLYETEIFGGPRIDAFLPAPASQILRPSKPGPVSQTGYSVKEAEGPKHLYILRMIGDEGALLGKEPKGCWVVKVGFSGSPDTRCQAHNKALPECAFAWKVLQSTYEMGRHAFPSSKHALAGEQAMKDLLEVEGDSLGGEFFLANEHSIKRAWNAALLAAENWTK